MSQSVVEREFETAAHKNMEFKAELYRTILNLKNQEQDARIGNIEARMDDITTKLNKAKYLYFPEETNESTVDLKFIIKGNLEEKKTNYNNEAKQSEPLEQFSSLEKMIDSLHNDEEMSYQVQSSARIIKEIRHILEIVPKQEGNYQRQLLLLFHEAIKRNYSKHIFTREQIMIFLEIVNACKKAAVSKDRYYQFDKELYKSGLNVLPAWE